MRMTEHPQNIAGPYQILSSRRPHNLAFIITFIITPINCVTITFIIILFNSVVSK